MKTGLLAEFRPNSPFKSVPPCTAYQLLLSTPVTMRQLTTQLAADRV